MKYIYQNESGVWIVNDYLSHLNKYKNHFPKAALDLSMADRLLPSGENTLYNALISDLSMRLDEDGELAVTLVLEKKSHKKISISYRNVSTFDISGFHRFRGLLIHEFSLGQRIAHELCFDGGSISFEFEDISINDPNE